MVSGVPQGCVLGPVLFLLFVNDTYSSIQLSLRMFADDCVVDREVVALQDCQDLHHLSLYLKTWQLTFNVSKFFQG